MVEGLHRMFAVRNVLEGNLCSSSEEPYTKNAFLQAKVKLRLYIVDDLDPVSINEFQELSLFIMKVKQSSLERTLYDELTQILNEMYHEKKILNLDDNKCLDQPGRHDSVQSNIMYEQRLYIYCLILNYAFNMKKSTVMYKMQCDHIDGVLCRQLILNKHAYLGLDDSVDLTSPDLFSLVKSVVLQNMHEKASEFSILCTRKDSTRNNDPLTKPLSQDIRVIMTFFLFASVNFESMKRACELVSSTLKFEFVQTNKGHADILLTMFRIIMTIHVIVDTYKREIGVASTEIHSGKISQLLCMNLFSDVMKTLSKVGHNPVLSATYNDLIERMDDGSVDDTVFMQLLKTWQDKACTYMTSLKIDDKAKWKNDLISLCKGETGTKTDVRLGKFTVRDLKEYCLPNILLLTTLFDSVGKVDIYQTQATERLESKSHDESDESKCHDDVCIPDNKSDDVDQDNRVVPNELIENECNVDDEEDSFKPKRKRQSSLEKDRTKKAKSVKLTKKMFDICGEVLKIYETTSSKESMGIPVDSDLLAIRNAWLATANEICKAQDLMELWTIHKKHLFENFTNAASGSQ